MNDEPFLRPMRIDPKSLRLEPLELDQAGFQSPLPVQNYALVFEDPSIGLAVGIWDTTTMQEAFGPYPGDEFITVLDGTFAIEDANGVRVQGSKGHSATFRNAIPVSWVQEGYLKKIYLTLQDPKAAEVPVIASAAGGVLVLDAAPAQRKPGADTAQAHQVLFRNDAGTMTVEKRMMTDDAAPAEACDRHELCRVLTGEMVLTDDDGRQHRFAANDHVFLPKGTVAAREYRGCTIAYHVFVKA